MKAVIADKRGVQDALSKTGFRTVSEALRQATLVAMDLGDEYRREIIAPFEAYRDLRPKVDRLWRELTRIAHRGRHRADYWSTEQQYARLAELQRQRYSITDPMIWALLLIHEPSPLPLGTPLVNRLSHALGFRPDPGLPFDIVNRAYAENILTTNRFAPYPHTLDTHRIAGDEVAAFMAFYLSKLDSRLIRTSMLRKLELIELEEGALAALDFLSTFGEIYRGWLMVAFAFLAPYALAPELVAAGGIATTTGVRAATQAENVATFVANGTEGSQAMLRIIDVGPAFLDLSMTLGTIFFERPPDKPLTPGEVFQIIMSGLGAIPSARLGYLMTGVSVATPFVATRDFIDWLAQAAASLEARIEAADAGADLVTVDSDYTLVLELEE